MTPELEAKLNGRRVVASVSGGKDSAALSLWLTEQGIEHDRVFMDTGWEHEATYEYLRGPLTKAIGSIIEIRPEKGMAELIREKGIFPTKGRRRWCTAELKFEPFKKYVRLRIDAGDELVSAVGVRAEESDERASMPVWEWSDDLDLEVWRPLLAWDEAQVIAMHTRHGLRPNPLYLHGARRVGCWPCIYARKSEIRLVAELTPGRIAEIRALEAEVTKATKARALAKGEELRHDRLSMFQPNGVMPIDDVVAWSQTSWGGKQFDMLQDAGRDRGCMRWGLCDTGGEP